MRILQTRDLVLRKAQGMKTLLGRLKIDPGFRFRLPGLEVMLLTAILRGYISTSCS